MNQGPLSPDGKYWWDGQKWNPVEHPAGPQPQPPRRPGKRSRWLTAPGVFLGLVLCFPIGLVLTWLMPWSKRTKLIVTGITSAVMVTLLIGASVSSPQSTTPQSATASATPLVALSATPTATPTLTLTSTPTAAATPAQTPQPTSHADYLAALRAQGVSAICNDDTLSYSRTRSGTCSHHQGVREWTGLI